MKWQRHLSGVGIGVRILSLQISIVAIATATALDGIVDHVMVQGSNNSGSTRTSSSYIDKDIIATANDTTHDQVLKGQSSPHHRRVSQKKHKPRIKRRLGIDVNVVVSVQVGEDIPDSISVFLMIIVLVVAAITSYNLFLPLLMRISIPSMIWI